MMNKLSLTPGAAECPRLQRIVERMWKPQMLARSGGTATWWMMATCGVMEKLGTWN